MSTIQAMILGAMLALALTPSVLLMTWALRRESKLPSSPQQPDILAEHLEDTAFDLQRYADRIHDQPSSPNELRARLELIRACKLVLAAAGYSFTVDEHRNIIIEEDDASNGESK
jgi:hypothetical protein